MRAMRKRMVREIVKRVKPRSGELGSLHVDAVLHLAQSGHSGKILQLPGGVEVRRERDSLVFCVAASLKDKAKRGTFSLHVHLPAAGEELRLDALSRILRLRVIDWPSEGRETSKTGAVLDPDRLRAPLELRNWRAGDAVRPKGHQNRHTVARLLNELGAVDAHTTGTVLNAALNFTQHWWGDRKNAEDQAMQALVGVFSSGQPDYAAVITRIKAIEGYTPLFQKAFPGEAMRRPCPRWPAPVSSDS